MSDYILTPVRHIVQSHNWDCGLACAKMVLSYLECPQDDFDAVYKEFDIAENVWTIDLAYIMMHYGVKHCMATITLGVDPGYHKEAYYKKSLNTEEIRINKKFDEAASRNVNVEKKSVTVDEIIRHLSQGLLAIVLIDWCHLKCQRCHSSFLSCGAMGGLCCSSRFIGHYILLCGYDKTAGTVLYKNPGINQELCCCSFDVLDKARTSFGTDEDFLFIYCNEKVPNTFPEPSTDG